MNKLKESRKKLKPPKETPAAHKVCAASGIKLRSVVFKDKKKQAEDKNPRMRDLLIE